MPIPASLDTRDVTVEYTDFVSVDGQTMTEQVIGTVQLECVQLVAMPTEGTFFGPFKLEAAFDPETGVATFSDVPICDDPDVSAVFDYWVEINVDGQGHRFRVQIESADPNPVSLASKAMLVDPVPGASYVTTSGAQTVSGHKTFTDLPTVPETPTEPGHVASRAFVVAQAASGVPDADGTTKGKLALTNHLGGTADAPQVVGLATAVLDDLDELFVHLTGDELIAGIKTFRRLIIELADVANPGLIIRQPNLVDDIEDTELLQVFYQLVKPFWLNEKGNPRIRRSDAEIPLKIFGRASGPLAVENDIFQCFDDGGLDGQGNPIDRTVARMGPHGSMYHALNDRSAWTNLGNFQGVFSAYPSPDANGDIPQIRVTEGGERIETSGHVVASGSATTDAVICNNLPIALTMLGMGGTKTTRPAHRRILAGGSQATGAQRLQVTTAGEIKLIGTLAAGTTLSLDGLSWRP